MIPELAVCQLPASIRQFGILVNGVIPLQDEKLMHVDYVSFASSSVSDRYRQALSLSIIIDCGKARLEALTCRPEVVTH